MAYIGIDPNVGDISFQTFTGDGSTTTFTLAQSVASGEAVIVTIGNVVQEPGASAAYVAYANTLTFSAAPANGDVITVRYFGRAVDQPLSYGMQLFKYVATASQTVFTGADSSGTVLAFSGTDVDVYLNGVHLDADDFTASSGDTITLATGATLNDELVIRAFRAFTITDTVSASSGGTFNGAVNVNGNVTADGLTVDGDLAVSAANSRMRLYETDTTDLNTQLQNQAGDFNIQTLNDSASLSTNRISIDHSTGDISFYENTGTTPSLEWKSATTSLVLTGRETSRSSNTYAFEIDNSAQSSNMTAAGAFNIKGYNGDSLTVDGKGDISFYDDSGVAKFYWDASAERLGIGTISPSALLTVEDTDAEINVVGTRGTGATHRIFTGGANSGNLNISTATGGDIYVNAENKIFRNAAGSNDHMRIDSSGSLLVGTTSKGGSEKFALIGGPCFNMAHASTGTIGVFRTAGISGGIVGSITVTGSSTAYNTSSDYRLKTAVNYDWDATTRLKQLRPARFEWIADGDDAVPVDGFLAHEVQSVVPEAITGTHNEVDDEGNPVYQGIDQSKLTPLLTKALIEAVEKIERLEARITALEAN